MQLAVDVCIEPVDVLVVVGEALLHAYFPTLEVFFKSVYVFL